MTLTYFLVGMAVLAGLAALALVVIALIGGSALEHTQRDGRE